nr:uncharacterized protein LOC129253610 [Lytechinus pictus]
MTYIDWKEGEPNNFFNNEDCIQVDRTGLWNDYPCTALLSAGVCKKAATRSRSKVFKKDSSNPGYCLRNNVIEEIDQSTLINCGGRCLMTEDCVSINYFPRRDRCQLNSVIKAEVADSDFVESSDCEYFDIFS